MNMTELATEVGTAAVVTGYLVGMVKQARPELASWLLVVTALVSGILATFLVSIAQDGIVVDPQIIAGNIIAGIMAAAAAAGLTRTDFAGERKRILAMPEPHG